MTKQTDLSPPNLPQRKKGHATELDRQIGSRLTEIRKKMGLTQAQLADKIEVSTQQYQKYEKGENRLSLSKALEMCRAIDLSPHILTQHIDPAFNGLSDSTPQRRFDDDDEENLKVFKDTAEIVRLYHGIEDHDKRERFLKAVKEIAKALSD